MVTDETIKKLTGELAPKSSKIYSAEQVSYLLQTGQAKTVTEARAILQSLGYQSPSQAVRGEQPKSIPPEARNVQFQFKPAEGERPSPLLPRGSVLEVTYEVPKNVSSVSPVSIATKSAAEQKQIQPTPQVVQPSSYVPPKTIMEQQAEKLIETTQKIQTLGGILETQPKEIGTPLSFAKSVGRGAMTIVSYPFLVGGVVGHTIFGLQYYPEETKEKFLSKIPTETPKAVVKNVQEYIQAWKERPVETGGELAGQIAVAYAISKAVQAEQASKIKFQTVEAGKIQPTEEGAIKISELKTKVEPGGKVYESVAITEYKDVGESLTLGKSEVITNVEGELKKAAVLSKSVSLPEKAGIVPSKSFGVAVMPREGIKGKLMNWLGKVWEKFQPEQPLFQEYEQTYLETAKQVEPEVHVIKVEPKPGLWDKIANWITKQKYEKVEVAGRYLSKVSPETIKAIGETATEKGATGAYAGYFKINQEIPPETTLSSAWKISQQIKPTTAVSPIEKAVQTQIASAIQPKTSPLPPAAATGTALETAAITKSQEAYFSRVGTPYMKEEVETRVVPVKPSVNQNEVQALMIKQMERMKQELKAKPILEERRKVETVQSIETQVQFEKTMQKLTQMQRQQLEQEQKQLQRMQLQLTAKPRVIPTTQTYGFRVYPPYLPFRVVRAGRQVRKTKAANVWKYFERQWEILGLHEFAKLFGGKGRRR